jgi:S-formylglutathione hydrolase FrmB
MEGRMKKIKEKLPDISWINDFTSRIPGVAHHTYFSDSMKREIGYAVYVPPGYDLRPGHATAAKKHERYPVIYWLHGKGGDESMGFDIRLFAFFHQAVTEGKVRPALVVCPNCGSYSMFCDSYDKTIMGETILIGELIGLLDATYMTIADGSGRAIEGFSMGGFGAIKTAFKFPEMFSSVVTYGASLHDLDSVSTSRPEVFERMFGANGDYFQQNSPYILAEKNAMLIKKNLKLKFINGSLDFTLQNNLKFTSLLDKLGINYDFNLLDGYNHVPIPYYEAEGLNGFMFHSQNFGSGREKKK